MEKEEKRIEIYSTDNLVHHKLHVTDQPVHTLPYQSNPFSSPSFLYANILRLFKGFEPSKQNRKKIT